MKKLLAVSLFSASVAMAYPAMAQVSVTFGEPAYATPAPAYVAQPDWPSRRHNHRHHPHDDYWARQRDQERLRHHY